jgi:outer membrane protein assembly factor BamB
MKIFITLCFFLVNLSFSQGLQISIEEKKNWAQWRGPWATGIAYDGNPPIEWSKEKNINWKVETPGKGHATPIIWGNQIFLSTAIPTDKTVYIKKPEENEGQSGRRGPRGVNTDKVHEFSLLSLDKNTGKILWQRKLREEYPADATHEFGSWASNSPVTDGENIYAYFGSRGLYCLDLKGNLKWERDFGKMEKVLSFGEGSSPLLYKDKLILVRDHEGQSEIYVLDKNSGKDVWKQNRDEVSSWSTPFLVEINRQTQIITSATNRIRSYDLETDKIIWEGTGMTRNVIPMPVLKDNILYLTSGFRGSALLAIDLLKAKGNIDNSDAIVWKYDKYTPYTPSPLLMGDLLYFMRGNNGRLSCLNANDGSEYYTIESLEGISDLFTSPIGVKDRIYILGREGLAYVIKHGIKFEVLAKNQLDDNFIASPVIIGDMIYLRGYKNLYCIKEK